MDFSENFVHITQDEIQGAFFDNKSSLLFTTMIYFMENEIVLSESFVIISDFKGYEGSKGHDKYSVSHFTKVILNEFCLRHPSFAVNKIIFQSDGTSQHFKQKYVLCQVLTLNFLNKESLDNVSQFIVQNILQNWQERFVKIFLLSLFLLQKPSIL